MAKGCIEKVLKVSIVQGNANQNSNKLSHHTRWNGYDQKNRKDVCRGKGGFTSAGVNWCQCKLVGWKIENHMAGPQKNKQ